MRGPLADKEKHLREIIDRQGRVGVAVSGGVDSSLLLHEACVVLGRDNVVGLFVASVLQPPGEPEHVRDVAHRTGCRLSVIGADPLSWPEFVTNPVERCYLCKKELYARLLAVLAEQDISCLMDGTNTSDLGDFRPGLRAIAELGVRTPFVEAGLDKAEIRELSRELGLANWDRPSGSCLATRIPSGIAITRDLLALVAQCEHYLHTLGFPGCRVRTNGKEARIELAAGHIERFEQEQCREPVLEFFVSLGLDRVLMDLAGR